MPLLFLISPWMDNLFSLQGLLSQESQNRDDNSSYNDYNHFNINSIGNLRGRIDAPESRNVSTRILLAFLCLLFILPWILFMTTSNGAIGMYLDKPDAILGNESDVYDCLWHFWWVRTALDEGADPRAYGGTTLAWHNMGWPDLFVSYITGAGYNFVMFLSAVFTAIAGYLLARSWGLGRNGSILAGFIIVWMPVHLIRMYQHYQIASIGFVLLVMLFLRKWTHHGGVKNLVLIGILSVLAVMESPYHGITIAIGWLITAFLAGSKYWKKSLFAGAAAAAGCILGSLWLFTAPGAFGQNPGQDWKEAVYWAAEPQSYFLPSFLGNTVVPRYMPNPFEGVVSPGTVVAVIALVYLRMKKSWKAIIALAVVMVLTMGPLLKLNGIPTPVPLPYMALVKLPWLSAARDPSRLAIVIGIMAALAAGAFIEKRKILTGWLLTGLIVIEITPLPLQSVEVTVPHYYSTTSGNGSVLEIPASERIRRYSLFEITDGSPRLVRFFARGGETRMDNIPPSLAWGSTAEPTEDDIISTGAATVIYNRWMFSDSVRIYYDSLYDNIFPEQARGDSVWVWTR